MMEIRKLIIGSTTETLVRTLFDSRIAEESTSDNLNAVSRAIKIRDLRTQVLSFVKRNPNSMFVLCVPELKSDKQIKLLFNNFVGEAEEDECSLYTIQIDDSFVTAEVIKEVEVGEKIKLTIRAE